MDLRNAGPLFPAGTPAHMEADDALLIPGPGLCLGLCRLDVDSGLGLLVRLEFHDSVREREEGVVPPYAYVEPRMVLGAPLPREDVAGLYDLAPELFEPEPSAFGVSTVSGAAAAFFCCHFELPPCFTWKFP